MQCKITIVVYFRKNILDNKHLSPIYYSLLVARTRKKKVKEEVMKINEKDKKRHIGQLAPPPSSIVCL